MMTVLLYYIRVRGTRIIVFNDRIEFTRDKKKHYKSVTMSIINVVTATSREVFVIIGIIVHANKLILILFITHN